MKVTNRLAWAHRFGQDQVLGQEILNKHELIFCGRHYSVFVELLVQLKSIETLLFL